MVSCVFLVIKMHSFFLGFIVRYKTHSCALYNTIIHVPRKWERPYSDLFFCIFLSPNKTYFHGEIRSKNTNKSRPHPSVIVQVVAKNAPRSKALVNKLFRRKNIYYIKWFFSSTHPTTTVASQTIFAVSPVFFPRSRT